jgi:hypothetical protein
VIEAPRSSRAHEGFEFGKRELDRIEVRTVRRQKPEARADAFNRGADLGLFVDGQIVEHHDVTGPQRGHQDLFNVGQKTRIVDRALKLSFPVNSHAGAACG